MPRGHEEVAILPIMNDPEFVDGLNSLEAYRNHLERHLLNAGLQPQRFEPIAQTEIREIVTSLTVHVSEGGPLYVCLFDSRNIVKGTICVAFLAEYLHRRDPSEHHHHHLTTLSEDLRVIIY